MHYKNTENSIIAYVQVFTVLKMGNLQYNNQIQFQILDLYTI